jgi:hypothetical protein
MVTFAAALLLAAVAGVAAARDGCKQVSGPFRASPVECMAGGVLCTHGKLAGRLVATYDFAMDAPPIPDPNDPTRLVFTGRSVITTRGGARLFGTDRGVIQVPSMSFVTTVTVTGGTRQYARASGQIVASGTLDEQGNTLGTYTGTICKAADNNDKDEDD